MNTSIEKANKARSAILTIDHSPTELVLLCICGDVAKVQYNFRLNGDSIERELIDKHDQSLRGALSHSIDGDLTDNAWTQATLGVKKGGLGLREAQTIALPAFIASRVASRPHVHEMAQHMEIFQHGAAAAIMEAYAKRTDEALSALVSTIDTGMGNMLIDNIKKLEDQATDNWKALFDNESQGPPAIDREHRRPRPPWAAPELVPNDEDNDPGHPNHRRGRGAMHIQQEIMTYIDAIHFARHRSRLCELGKSTDLRRLNELSHKDTDHTWLWALSPHKGPVLDATDHIEATRLRLGIAGPTDPIPCRLCGKEVLNTNAAHALC